MCLHFYIETSNLRQIDLPVTISIGCGNTGNQGEQIFEVDSISAEICKVSGRNFHYESYFFEDPWWQELFQNCCNF